MDNIVEEEAATAMDISIGSISEIEEVLDDVDVNFKRFKKLDAITASRLLRDSHFLCNRLRSLKRRPQLLQVLFGLEKPTRTEQLRTRRMEDEWKILEAGLPNSICVRGAYQGSTFLDYEPRYLTAYESKLIMRAVIVGLEGSPRSYGLFFFDIFLPENYPSEPPELSLRPYRGQKGFNGDICKDINKAVCSWWDSETCNILRMLGFIQAQFVMNTKIYSKDDEEEFVFTHQAMLSSLLYPPDEFKDFVRGHFRKYSHEILLKFKGKGSSDEISKMFAKLVRGFKYNGSYCDHLVGILGNEQGSISSAKSPQKNTEEDCSRDPPFSELHGFVSRFCTTLW